MRVVKCSDPDRFQPSPYWASQGLEAEEEVRWEMLWQAATSENDIAKQALEHAEGCDYCGDILDRFKGISDAMKPDGPVDLAICPSAAELFDYAHGSLSTEVQGKIASHLQRCSPCAKELKWLINSEKWSNRPVLMTPRAKQITGLAIAASLIIGGVIFATVATRSGYTPIVDHVYSTKYRDLAKLPPLDRADLIKTAPPSHWTALERAMSALELGDYDRGLGLAARLVNQQDEPAAEYVLGRALYLKHMVGAANEAILKSERMQPMSGYRCWSALQMGLILGEKDVIERECKHLAGHKEYADAVAQIREEVRKRG